MGPSPTAGPHSRSEIKSRDALSRADHSIHWASSAITSGERRKPLVLVTNMAKLVHRFLPRFSRLKFPNGDPETSGQRKRRAHANAFDSRDIYGVVVLVGVDDPRMDHEW